MEQQTEQISVPVEAIVSSIVHGELTLAELDHLRDAVIAKRDVVARMSALELAPGDHVEVVPSARPKYLAGRTGVYNGRAGQYLQVRFDEALHGARGFDHRVSGKQWRMHPGSVRKIAHVEREAA